MRICYLADATSIHTKRWCSHFSSLGHEVHLITFQMVEIEGTEVHFVDIGSISRAGGNWKSILAVPKVKQILNAIRPDVLHAHYATSYGFCAALTGFHPLVVTALGTDVLISPNQSFLYRSIVQWTFKKADWVTAMADHMREKILRLGIDSYKVETVMFGIDPQIFFWSKSTSKGPDFVVTSTRNFEPVYDIETLVRAFSMVSKQIVNLKLNLIGDGTQRQKLEDLVLELGIAERVVFHGKIDQPQIAKVLNESHIFVSSSKSDGNNVSLNEAFACGVLSIATDIPANQQWIMEGQNGFLFETGNAQSLVEKLMIAHSSFDSISIKFAKINSKIIEERAIWSKNMQRVEEKYQSLKSGQR
jgi:L-malate glycosyltransferase